MLNLCIKNLENINFFVNKLPFLDEVSIGHAIVCESLYLGIENVINMYLQKITIKHTTNKILFHVII